MLVEERRRARLVLARVTGDGAVGWFPLRRAALLRPPATVARRRGNGTSLNLELQARQMAVFREVAVPTLARPDHERCGPIPSAESA